MTQSYEIARLRDAYLRMQFDKKMARERVISDHRRTLEREISAAQAEVEIAFAKELHRAASEGGISGNLIRSEVLRTQDWGRWIKWRDLAEIEPDRLVAATSKAEQAKSEATWIWDPENLTLTIQRYPGGENLETPLVFDINQPYRIVDGWAAKSNDDDIYLEIMKTDREFFKKIRTEVDRLIRETL